MLQKRCCITFRGSLHEGKKIQEPGRSYKAEQLFVGFTCRNFSPCSYLVEKLLTIAGDNYKHYNFSVAAGSSLQLVVPSEIVDLYCCDYLPNDLLPFLSSLFLVLGSSS